MEEFKVDLLYRLLDPGPSSGSGFSGHTTPTRQLRYTRYVSVQFVYS